MPDITMCTNGLCPMAGSCHRFLAKPSRFQSFSDFEPEETEDGDMTCKYYWKVEDDNDVAG